MIETLVKLETHKLGRVVLTGGTGMVGASVLTALLEAEEVSEVVSLARRSVGQQHRKLTEFEVTDFGNPDAIAAHLENVDTVFHCLATYSSRVSRRAYQEITVHWLQALLKACEIAPSPKTFCLFSAAGARPGGGGLSFALRIKGQAETALFSSNIVRKYIFRPGYIAPSGSRKTWKPAGHVFVPIQRLIPSIGITSDELASIMLKTAISHTRPSAVLENGEMRTLLE